MWGGCRASLRSVNSTVTAGRATYNAVQLLLVMVKRAKLRIASSGYDTPVDYGEGTFALAENKSVAVAV